MKALRVLFFTDNFPPEGNAPANRTYEHCKEWVKQGVQVTVITCNPNYPKGELFPGYKNRLYKKEMMDGIKVIRVWTYITPNSGTIKRILDYTSFAITSFIASLFHKCDVIVATSPQLFTAVGGCFSAWIKRKPWVMEVRDLWPESIQALDAINNKTILTKLEKLVGFLYRKANMIIVVTDTFKKRIANEGIDKNKIKVVKNGVDLSRYYKMEPNQSLMDEHRLNGKFVVGYIGTHGMAHGLDFILNSANKIEDPDIHFLFVGHGALKTRLVRQKNKLGLTNVSMLDAVHRDKVKDYISTIDVALVPLKRLDTFKTVIPSKIFENAAMAKPILLGVEGESQKIIEDYSAGLYFTPEDSSDFIDKLITLKEDDSRREEWKQRGLRLARDFDRERLAIKMLSNLESLVPSDVVPSEELVRS